MTDLSIPRTAAQARPVHAPTGTTLHCRNWLTEAAYRMLQNNLDPAVAEHPDTLANGWDQIYINEAGFDDEGTSIQSIFGEQVLAIDAKDGVLLLRISGKGYRGVLAVGRGVLEPPTTSGSRPNSPVTTSGRTRRPAATSAHRTPRTPGTNQARRGRLDRLWVTVPPGLARCLSGLLVARLCPTA